MFSFSVMETWHLFSCIFPICIGLCLRSAVSLLPYSGHNCPPMFGDFEAQRHWMEITVNLPISQWYHNSSNNDLSYWGLDYPPLTAYHSFLMGKIGEMINGSWVALHSSRGIETMEHKIFMRYTVLISDVLTFMPATIFFAYVVGKRLTTKLTLSSVSVTILFLTFPGLIIIDHSHFQYNCASLGLYVFALSFIICEYESIGSIAFCLALFYKQMELYHALPFFFFLFGKCFCCGGLFRFTKLVVAVVLSIVLLLSPFLHSIDQLVQIGIRMFPVTRGLYEDKVANFWCISSVIFKWKQILHPSSLLICCFLTTLLASLPSCMLVFWKPTKIRLVLAQTLVSLSFFLFSYQVHEKSILLCAIPALCLLPVFPLSSIYFCLVATLSLWPLLLKDHLAPACFALTAVFYVTSSVCFATDSVPAKKINLFRFWPLTVSLLGYLTIFGLETLIPPPVNFPFIFPLAVNAFSFAHFVGFLVFWHWRLFNLPANS